MANFFKLKKTLPPDEISMFCEQVALILKSGIQLHDGMDTLCEGIEDEKAKKIFSEVSEVVSETGSLHKGLETVGIFPEYMVNMVLIGEEAGKLEEVMESLSLYYENENTIKKSIYTAISYPILLVCMMAVVLTVLITRVMPLFEEIFKNLGTEMSGTGKMIMGFGINFGKITLIVIVAVLVIALLIYLIVAFTGNGHKVREVVQKLPFLKKLNKTITSARLSSVLAMMLSSGLELEKALELAPGVVSDRLTKQKLKDCSVMVQEGTSFVEAITKIKVFPALHTRMINVGFKAGQLDGVMKRLSKLYEDEVNDEIAKVVSFIEPTMVAFLSVIIGGILISIMLPLASIMSSIG
ncbi:MAG: type II secretion system F family protein [Lachnospiraceae bacterium]|nr:type II secretion system F family protein [Lachnospiraceae bacterium]